MPIPSPNPSLRPQSLVAKRQNAQSRLESPSRAPPEASASNRSTNNTSHLPQPNPALQPNASDVAKRRSFLPQPGELRYALRRNDQGRTAKNQGVDGTDVTSAESVPNPGSSAPSQDVALPSSREGRLRPRSMYQTSSAQPEQYGEVERGKRTHGSHVQKVAESSLGRLPSLRRPGTSTNQSQSTTDGSHSRTKSTSTAASFRKASVDIKTRQERPKSLLVPPSGSVRMTSKGSTDTVAGASKNARLGALKRSTSVKTKPEATDQCGPADAVAKAETGQQASSLLSKPGQPAKQDPKKQSRPAFSTLQQHFTPRKAGKAPTSTFLHPPAPDVGTNNIPPELISLQTELLQLHLLHQSSAKVSRQWELSAKKTLRRKFDEVTSLYQVMRDNERQAQEQRNIRALRDWNGDNMSFALAEHIQVLCGPLHELPSLLGPDGRYNTLVNKFQQWIAWVEDMWSSREDVMRDNMDLESAEGLGDAWKVENAALTRRLTTYSRELERLAQPAKGSSIALIVATCKELLSGMLDELQMMQRIEAGVVATEKDWIEARLKAITHDIGAHVSTEDVEVWKS